MITSPVVSFGLFALTLKEDATLSFSRGLQTFSKLDDLLTGNVANKPYITFEPDLWLLDGEYKFKPDDALVHVAIMSTDMSDENGVLVLPPVLTVSFSTVHQTDGLNLRGDQHSEDWANEVVIEFFDEDSVSICQDTYYPESWEFSTNKPVTGFKFITITFNSTNKPFRYLRMTGIDFGQLTYFTGADIREASITEEMHPLSIILPIDTCELQIYSSDANFSIMNAAGDYLALQEKQPLDVYEMVDNDLIYMGRFYLDAWDNPTEYDVSFKCIDVLGVLDGITYLGGMWSGDTVLTVLEDILGNNNIPYDVDPNFANELVTGWLPISTCREALQQLAFALGGHVSCARSGVVQIYDTTLASDITSFDYDITTADRGINQNVKLAPLVTGVEITAHNYVEDDLTYKELFNGTLVTGNHLIKFQEPMHDLAITGGTITSSGANYALINVTVQGTVVLGGYVYSDTYKVVGVYNETLDSTVKDNIVKIDKATLVNSTIVNTLTQKVYDYYQQRYIHTFKLIRPEAQVGSSATVVSLFNNQIGGVIEKMHLDLAKGFIADVSMTGVVQ